MGWWGMDFTYTIIAFYRFRAYNSPPHNKQFTNSERKMWQLVCDFCFSYSLVITPAPRNNSIIIPVLATTPHIFLSLLATTGSDDFIVI